MVKYKKSSRFIISIILIAMMIPMLYINSFAVNPTIAVSSVSGNIGETVNVTVSVLNNPGIVSMTLKVDYDSNLELTNVSDTGLLPGSVHKSTFSNPYTLAWANDTATSNYKVNGNLVTLVFKIRDTAIAGEKYDVSVSYNMDNYDIYDKDVNCVSFAVANGGVTVNKPLPILSSISVMTNPTKTTYYVGDTLDTTGLTLTARYSDNTTKTVSSGFTCSPIKLNTAGSQTITVSYLGKTTSFNVTVNNSIFEIGKVKSVSIDDISMRYKDTATIAASIVADTGVSYDVKYKSLDTDVAKVDNNGKVIATGKGSTTITCTVTDQYGNVATDTCTVKVNYSFGQWLLVIFLFGWIWY